MVEQEFKDQMNENKYLKYLGAMKRGLQSLMNILMDIELFYFALFWALLMVSAFDHPLLVCVHLSIIIIQSSVIKDLLIAIITVSRKIIATLVLLLLVIYWLTLWSFDTYAQYYPDNTCNSLLKCYFVGIDQNFKSSGAELYVSSVLNSYDDTASKGITYNL